MNGSPQTGCKQEDEIVKISPLNIRLKKNQNIPEKLTVPNKDVIIFIKIIYYSSQYKLWQQIRTTKWSENTLRMRVCIYN